MEQGRNGEERGKPEVFRYAPPAEEGRRAAQGESAGSGAEPGAGLGAGSGVGPETNPGGVPGRQPRAGLGVPGGTGRGFDEGLGQGLDAGGERRSVARPRPCTAHDVVEPLRYLAANGEEPAAEPTVEGNGASAREWEERLQARDAEWQARLETVRREALAAGRAEMEGHRMELLRGCAAQWAQAVDSFAHARDAYFARVEREVVELALAIAARILQREAQVDPLLLAGAVQVALGQLAESTSVELRVPSEDQELWSETLRLMPNLPVMPTVVGDREMNQGECSLTTELGRVDLGVRAQLKEIERGFFDLLSHRDAATVRAKAGMGA